MLAHRRSLYGRQEHGILRWGRIAMERTDQKKPLQIAILLYPGATALDAVVRGRFCRDCPRTEIGSPAKKSGPIVTEGNVLFLGVTHTVRRHPRPTLWWYREATTTPNEMVDDEILDWLRKVHETTLWTVSVCTGALILGAAGILKGMPATTHWYKMGALRIMGAKPQPEERVVQSGKVVTAAGIWPELTRLCGWRVRSPDGSGRKRFN